MQHAASAITAPDTGQLPVYWQFHEAVTRAQLTEWLPTGRHLLVDVSGPRGPGAELAAKAGHTVLRVLDGARQERPTRTRGRTPGKIVPVIADSSRLTFLGDGCADGVIADDRALSVYLAAEAMIAEIARVLRPAGRVIACVDSLVLGMAVLADQHHWAHLVDLPHAEVVLVPWPDGRITRCYGPDQARELFTGAGLRVNWIRSRTVFSESVVTHWLRRDPGGLAQAGAGRTRGPVRRVARGAAGDLGQQAALAPLIGTNGGAWPTWTGSRRSGRRRGGRRACPRVSRGRSPRTARSWPRRCGTARRAPRHAGSRADRRIASVRSASERMDPASPESCRIPRARHGPGALALQDGDRPVQVVAHLLQALAGDSSLHWCPRLPSACGRQRRLALAPSHVLRAADSEQLSRAASHRQRKPRLTHRRSRAA